MVDDNLIDHTPIPGQPGEGRGREQHRRFIRGFRNAFPDWQETIDFMTAEGDRVVIHHTGRGTHQGAFMGKPPTNKQITAQAVDTIRINPDGRIVEHWGTNPWRGPV